MRRKLLLLTALILLFLLTGRLLMTSFARDTASDHDAHPHAAKLKNDDGSWKYTNALIDETSPYLLQHAHNPVDWRPWGQEAFELARRQQKPIFLSVGYSTCYWCHVMERQVFEDPAIAAKMNELFVNIKVDREERPDVDDIYMTATQIMTRSGGWPMSVFLTPPPPPPEDETGSGTSVPVNGANGVDGVNGVNGGLKPFWCGTYLPPEPMHGRPSFPQVLEALHQAWKNQRGEVLEQADRVADAVTRALSAKDTRGPLDADPVQHAAQTLMRMYDDEHGGFGDAPKFPQPANLAFLFAVHENNPGGQIGAALHHTLDRMARGGMYDQVGGGFHRYSVDERWLVPHFEKMLYDNGQLLSVYTRGLEAERRAHGPETDRAVQYQRILRETADYVLREMRDDSASGGGTSGGAFFSAQDAEVNAKEGANYLWTEAQVREAIDDEELASLAVRMYGLDEGPNFRDPHDPDATPANVLYLPRPLPELAEQRGVDRGKLLARRDRINAQLLAVRDQREQPGTDDKVLVAWNGMMIKGLAEAGAALDEPRYLDAAEAAADTIIEHMADPRQEDGLLRSMRDGEANVPAFLEDYAHFASGLIALHRAGVGGGRYLDHAARYLDAAAERFASDGGGYFDTLADQDDLFVRVRSTWDGAVPTGNAVMIHNLLDLYALTNKPAYLTAAVRDLRSFAEPLKQQGAGMVHMQHALLRALEHAPDALAAPTQPSGGADADAQTMPRPVTADAAWRDQTLRVTLEIAEGYHINAHDVSDDADAEGPALIPTTLRLEGPGSIEATWPEPATRRFAYADQPLRVYEGEVTLEVSASGLAEDSRLSLTAQPCTDQACLTPQTIAVTIPPR